jgi:fatty-acyl-CoA synthase
MVDEVRDELHALEQVVFFDSPEWDALAAGEQGPDGAELRARMDELDFDDPINIQYTSGTTGRPKGATLTHHNILNNALLLSGILGYTEADRVCIPVPLYHCFGMVIGNLACSLSGACIVYPETAFDPLATLEAMTAERCTSVYGVPTMFIAELDHPRFSEFDLSSLRTGIMAGSPCPIEVMRRVGAEMGIEEMTIAFGMTETSPASTLVRPDDTLEHRCETVGEAMPHTEIKIVDPVSERTVGRGESGEFRTRGYLVMSGYWDDPERTAEAVDAAGWMHTGDLATMDDDGYIRIVGRIKDMIIRGGENVYPREIEEFLYGHPAVADVQVVGVPDERYGEEIMAWVIAREGATVDEDELREYCRGKIARYKIPRYVASCTEFPMTVTGKIQKHELRAQAMEKLGMRTEAGVPS